MTAPTASSLMFGPATPAAGQAVTFTAVYSHVAQARTPQYPNQPLVQVNGPGFQQVQETTNKTPLGSGWVRSTYPITLGAAGDYSAVLYYHDKTGTLVELAFAYFTVTA